MGTSGGHGQPQFLAEVYNNLFHFGMTPQEAVEAPRTLHNNGLNLQLENRVAADVLAALKSQGHAVRAVDGWTAALGGVEVILSDPATGTWRSGADPRREAYGVAY